MNGRVQELAGDVEPPRRRRRRARCRRSLLGRRAQLDHFLVYCNACGGAATHACIAAELTRLGEVASVLGETPQAGSGKL